ncbi:hypothetical protein [Pelagibacterium luteolum]|uniref:hypothetical protein n=1 Tax=Pelagibacterium luteolum TaxID=440168 RepID=UPI001AECFFA0|nr:hypothetical protein [Pelagibacterium luteolum]
MNSVKRPSSEPIAPGESECAIRSTRKTGDLFEAATVSPVAITKPRKPRYVIMSMERYESLTHGQDTRRAFRLDDLDDRDADKLIADRQNSIDND